MSCRGAGLQVKPMKIYCQNVKTWCGCIDENDTGATLAGLFITFYSAGNAAEYYLWFDDGVAADPAPGGTGIPVAVTALDTAETIAAAVVAAVDAVADFCSVAAPFDKKCFVVKVTDYLATNDPIDGTGGVVEQTVEHEGFSLDLGFTDGDFAPSFNPEFTDITCHQSGSSIVNKVLKGVTPQLDVTFKECRKEILDKLISGGLGGICTLGGNDYRGFGTAQIGKNALTLGNRITLHPVSLPVSDRSQDWTMLLAIPEITAVTYSGENPFTVSASFTALPDLFWKCNESNVVIEGDHLIG